MAKGQGTGQGGGRGCLTSCIVGMSKTLFVLINVVFLLAAVAILAVGIISLRTNNRIPENKQGSQVNNNGKLLSKLVIGLGACLLVISFLGCCGALAKSNLLLCCYLVVVVLIFAAQCAIAYHAVHAARGHSLQSDIDSAWRSSDNNWKTQVQDVFKCCGLMNSTDDAGMPCPDNLSQPPAACYPTIRSDLVKAFHIIKIVLLVIACIELFGMCTSCMLMCSHKTQMDPEKQSLLLNSAYANQANRAPAYNPGYSRVPNA